MLLGVGCCCGVSARGCGRWAAAGAGLLRGEHRALWEVGCCCGAAPHVFEWWLGLGCRCRLAERQVMTPTRPPPRHAANARTARPAAAAAAAASPQRTRSAAAAAAGAAARSACPSGLWMMPRVRVGAWARWVGAGCRILGRRGRRGRLQAPCRPAGALAARRVVSRPLGPRPACQPFATCAGHSSTHPHCRGWLL